MQLLDDVMRSRRELENTFDSIAHLVVVVRSRAAASSTSTRRSPAASDARASELLDRPLAECIGPELAAWLATHESAAPRADGDAAGDAARSSTRC